MKQIMAILLVACLLVLAGCAGKGTSATPTAAPDDGALDIDLPSDTGDEGLAEIGEGMEEVDLDAAEEDVDFGSVI